MRRFVFAIVGITAATAAYADGFAVKDLGTLQVDPTVFQGGTYDAGSTEPARLTVFCTDCSSQTIIDIRLGRSTDGTEERYRSGETTVEQMEAICKSRSESCELKAAEVGDAVGWVTSYEASGGWGSTTVLFKDGDLLTIRSIAASKEQAIANGATARGSIAPMIIGIK